MVFAIGGQFPTDKLQDGAHYEVAGEEVPTSTGGGDDSQASTSTPRFSFSRSPAIELNLTSVSTVSALVCRRKRPKNFRR